MPDISGYLNIIRNSSSGEQVRDAICNCMKDINADSAVKPTSLIITKADNVTYKPGVGKAFKSVTVNIDSSGESDPAKTISYETLTVNNDTLNGTYPRPEDGDIAYSKVEVEIDWDALESGVILGEEATMTNLHVDETTGRKFWVAADAGYDYVKQIWVGVDTGLPSGGGSGGGGGGASGGNYQARFCDKNGTLAFSVTVPYGTDLYNYTDSSGNNIGSKIDAIKNDAPSGKEFNGWDGVPNQGIITCVTANFTAVPRYRSKGAGGSIGDKSWEDVLKDSTKFATGETIMLDTDAKDMAHHRFTSYADYDNEGKAWIDLPAHKWTNAERFHWKFMLVAHGAYGSASTFLACSPINKSVTDIINICGGDYHGDLWNYSPYGSEDMVRTLYYQMLNYIYEMFPDVVRSKILPFISIPQYGYSGVDYPVQQIRINPNDYIMVTKRPCQGLWLPSMTELGSLARPTMTNHYVAYDSETGYPTDQGGYVYSDDDTLWEMGEGDGSVDYGATLDKGNRWFPTGTGNIRISTRSTVTAKFSRNGVISPTAKGLYFENNKHPSDGYDGIIESWDSFNNWYVGFHVST